jgi:CRP-like cAMP-binding protein
MTSNFAEFEPSLETLGVASGFIDEFAEAVQSQPLFDDFTKEETAVFSGYLECFGVSRKSIVVREGDEGNFLAILVTGRAMVLKSYNGVEKMVQELVPGDVIGEMSLIDGKKRFATCVAIAPSDFAVMSSENLHTLLAEHPALGNKFLMKLLSLSVARLRHATETMLPGLLPVPV